MKKNTNHPILPTQHSMKRRAPWHDYKAPGAYMLTLSVEGRRPLLGRLVVEEPPVPERTMLGQTKVVEEVNAYIKLSPLGKAVLQDAILKIPHYYPQVEVWRVCIMPDHMHLIVRVKEPFSQGKSLGNVVNGLKVGCNRAWREWLVRNANENGKLSVNRMPPEKKQSESAEPPVPERTMLGQLPRFFEKGYNDRLLFDGEQLERWKHYLDDNPRRLALKRLHPDLFTVKHRMAIAGHQCQTVGNQFLLDIPDKVAVIVHRRYTDSQYQRLTEAWLACGERGGVLVSVAISPKEKEVLTEARKRGYNIIWLNENGFPEFYKPTGKAFDACSSGQLLQICPWEYHTEKRTITREQCLELNAMAIEIAGGETEISLL